MHAFLHQRARRLPCRPARPACVWHQPPNTPPAHPHSHSPPQVRAVQEFDPSAAALLLEEEVREAFLGTAGTAAGAQGLGLLAAGWLGSSLEDLLALALAGAASYVAVLNLPLRRADIKSKVAAAAGKFGDGVEAAMGAEVAGAVAGVLAEVEAALAPVEEAYRWAGACCCGCCWLPCAAAAGLLGWAGLLACVAPRRATPWPSLARLPPPARLLASRPHAPPPPPASPPGARRSALRRRSARAPRSRRSWRRCSSG
jgi:hypothetical protein